MEFNRTKFLLLSLISFFLFPRVHSVNCPRRLPQEGAGITTRSRMLSSRIIYGTISSASKTLYHAIIRNDRSGEGKFCTGVRISRYWLLTAAHCRITSKEWVVVLGSGGTYSIDKIYRHPKYIRGRVPHPYDIALVRMKDRPTSLLRYPLLNRNSRYPSSSSFARVSGYGETEYGKSSRSLREVDVPVTRSALCLSIVDDNRQVCTGYRDRGCNICAGDSGGPLVQFDRQNRPVIVALTSTGPKNCGWTNVPVVSVRVSAYLSWMDSYDVPYKTGVPRQVM